MDAKRFGYDAWRVQSTGEKVAVALVLNRPDWLADMGYTIAEAVGRAGPEWMNGIERVERALLHAQDGDETLPAGHQIGHRAWTDAGIEALGQSAQKLG